MRRLLRWTSSAVSALTGGSIQLVRSADLGLAVERHHLRRFLTEFRVDCIFDVGANVGQYADMVRSLGFAGDIVSFEPLPAAAAELRLRSSADKNWYIEEVALDDEAHETTFNVMAGSQFSSLKKPNGDEFTRLAALNAVESQILIKTAALGPFFRQYRHKLGFERPFLKLDTQGNDLNVARGAGYELAKFVGIQSEMAFKRLYHDQCTYRESLDFYTGEGFTLSAIVPNNRGHFPDLIEMDCILYNPALTTQFND